MITSGDGGLFPAGLLVGQVAQGPDRRMRVRLAADYERLEFLRVLRSQPIETIEDPGGLLERAVPPDAPPPDLPAAGASNGG